MSDDEAWTLMNIAVVSVVAAILNGDSTPNEEKIRFEVSIARTIVGEAITQIRKDGV